VKLRVLLPLLFVGASLAGCLGNSGSALPPPNGINSVEGDSIAGVSWIMEPGVSYMTFGGTSPQLTTLNWATNISIGGFALNAGNGGAVSPAVLCSVPNGNPYYFTIDAHSGTSPGGPGSPVVGSTARPAGGAGTWTPGNFIGTRINGIGYATYTTCLLTGPGTGRYVAVGPAGAILSSSDGFNWTSRTPAGFATDLYAVAALNSTVNSPAGPTPLFVAVGAGGAAIRSTDGVTWTSSVPTNGSGAALRAITLSGSTFIAVGDGGRIQVSADGANWVADSSNTTVDLHAIQCVGATCVAVGDAGVIDISFDSGGNWTVNTVGAGGTALRAVAFGNDDDNIGTGGVIGDNWLVAINTWVVVGDNGTAYQTTGLTTGVTSSAWNAVPVAGAANLVALGYSTHFIAIDSAGNAFTNVLGTAGNWSAPVPSGITDPIAMTGNGHGSTSPTQLSSTYWNIESILDNSHGFVLVGASGDSALSF